MLLLCMWLLPTMVTFFFLFGGLSVIKQWSVSFYKYRCVWKVALSTCALPGDWFTSVGVCSLWILMKYYWQTSLKVCAVYFLFIWILFSLVNEHILSFFSIVLGLYGKAVVVGITGWPPWEKARGCPCQTQSVLLAPTHPPWGTPESLSQVGGTSTRTLKKR